MSLNNLPSLNKPVDAINKIIETINDGDSEIFILQRYRELTIINAFGDNYIYFFTEGSFSLSRSSDNLFIAALSAPFIIGLTLPFNKSGQHFIFSETECRGFRISEKKAIEKINQYNLWKDVASILSYHIRLLIQRDEQLVGVSAYTTIRYSLLKLMEMSQQERMNINVEKFIQQHTKLSRSGIMKILSNLRAGNYIQMHRGRLIDVDNLPENY